MSKALFAQRSADAAHERKPPRCGGESVVLHRRDRAGRQRFRRLTTDDGEDADTLSTRSAARPLRG